MGEGKTFYSADEVVVAYNEGKLSKHAIIKVKANLKDKKTGDVTRKLIETVTGRVIFNQVVPEEVATLDELLTKKKFANDHS